MIAPRHSRHHDRREQQHHHHHGLEHDRADHRRHRAHHPARMGQRRLELHAPTVPAAGRVRSRLVHRPAPLPGFVDDEEGLAALRLAAADADGGLGKQLERLCWYMLRPPFARYAVQVLQGGRVRVHFKAPWRCGAAARRTDACQPQGARPSARSKPHLRCASADSGRLQYPTARRNSRLKTHKRDGAAGGARAGGGADRCLWLSLGRAANALWG